MIASKCTSNAWKRSRAQAQKAALASVKVMLLGSGMRPLHTSHQS